MNVFYFIIVGLIAGWLAGGVMRGGGYGIVPDIALGVLGGVMGGWIFGVLGIWPAAGFLGAILVSTIGAVFLIGTTRLLKRA